MKVPPRNALPTFALALLLIAGANAQAADPEQARAMAASLYSSGNPDAAITLLREFVQKHPSEMGSRIDLARYYAYRKQYDNAASEYNEVLRRQPGSLPAKLGLAKIASWQGDFDKALEIYDEVLRRSPSFYDARVGKGFTLAWMGRNEEAYALLSAAAKSHPYDAETVAEAERLSRIVRKQVVEDTQTKLPKKESSAPKRVVQPAVTPIEKPRPAAEYPQTFAEPVAPAQALPQGDRPIWPWLIAALGLIYAGFFVAYRQLKKTATALEPKLAARDEPKRDLKHNDEELSVETSATIAEPSGLRVLIAEEAPEIADFLRMVFAQLGATSVDHVAPERAIECLGIGIFDLCVLPTTCAAQLGVALDEGTVPKDALGAVVFSCLNKEEGERIAAMFGCRYLTKPLRVAAVAALLQPEIIEDEPVTAPRRSYSVDRHIYMTAASAESGSPAGHD